MRLEILSICSKTIPHNDAKMVINAIVLSSLKGASKFTLDILNTIRANAIIVKITVNSFIIEFYANSNKALIL